MDKFWYFLSGAWGGQEFGQFRTWFFSGHFCNGDLHAMKVLFFGQEISSHGKLLRMEELKVKKSRATVGIFEANHSCGLSIPDSPSRQGFHSLGILQERRCSGGEGGGRGGGGGWGRGGGGGGGGVGMWGSCNSCGRGIVGGGALQVWGWWFLVVCPRGVWGVGGEGWGGVDVVIHAVHCWGCGGGGGSNLKGCEDPGVNHEKKLKRKKFRNPG